MKIRKLNQEEKQQTKPLYQRIFHEDSESFVDYYYSEKTKDNTIYIVEEEGIRSMLHLNPYMIRVNGKEEPAHYIVAVATEKDFRKRGYMTALLKTALRDMYAAGEPFTFLMPAAEEIYLPHGFSTVYEQNQRYLTNREAAGQGFRPARQADAPAMAVFAETFLRDHYQVYAKRDRFYYERLMREYESDGGFLAVREQDGKITDIRPCVDETPAAEARIMVRAVHVKRLLLLLGLNYLTAVCFRVTDPYIEENNQVFMVTGTEYSGVMLMEGRPENSEGTLPVDALTKLVFGAATVDEIAARKDVVMTERMGRELEKIVPLSHIWLNEIV